jgi:chorismate dehydratase
MQKNMKLRIGRIAYANLFPIFYTLEKEFDCSAYEFVDGVPSAVNRMIRAGEIDISPSSSIEYFRNSDRYLLIENHSISSAGPVRSIFLFSKRPIETLDGHTVLVTSQSETSVALLRIILEKFYGLECIFSPTSEPLGKAMLSNDAYLLIGDDALVEARRRPELRIYDLGDLWYRNTGLPFAFALWIVTRGCCIDEPELFEKFKKDLDASKVIAVKNLERIAEASPLRGLLSVEELVEYWQGISYDYNDEHKRGFDLFRRYAGELGLI